MCLISEVGLYMMFVYQIPLFGIMSSDSADPFYWMRVILASNRGISLTVWSQSFLFVIK